MNNEEKIFKVLKDIGVPRSIAGYEYIKESLMIMLESDELMQLTKMVYPKIAKKYNVSASSIERSIKFAVTKTFDNIQTEAIEKIFVNLSYKKSQPSNKEFLASIVEYLKCHRY